MVTGRETSGSRQSRNSCHCCAAQKTSRNLPVKLTPKKQGRSRLLGSVSRMPERHLGGGPHGTCRSWIGASESERYDSQGGSVEFKKISPSVKRPRDRKHYRIAGGSERRYGPCRTLPSLVSAQGGSDRGRDAPQIDNTDTQRGVAQINGAPAGFIGIQSYPNSPVAFRNIWIK